MWFVQRSDQKFWIYEEYNFQIIPWCAYLICPWDKTKFSNNTTLRCESLIFITQCETECLGYASNHMIIVPDKPYFIGKSECSDKCYRFVPNYIYGENESVNLNSYITVLVYPEIENALWFYKYGFKRNYKNLYYTYKFKLVHYQKCKEIEHYVI